MLLGSIILLFLIGFDGQITRLEGIVFLLVYVFYLFAIQREEKVHEKVKRAPTMHFMWDILSVIAGLAIVIYSSNIVVGNAVFLAELWGVKQSLIGIIIVGLGTSLPELILSLGAVLKGAPGLSIGNLVGSNIFDILLVLGVGSTISGLSFSRSLLFFDLPFLFILSVITLLFFVFKKGLQKKEAFALVIFYLLYILLKIKGF